MPGFTRLAGSAPAPLEKGDRVGLSETAATGGRAEVGQIVHDFGAVAVAANERLGDARREDGGTGDSGGSGDAGAPPGISDAGEVSDAGPGPDGGSSPGPVGPGPSPPGPVPGPPLRVLRVEVRADHRPHFPQIPGTTARTHWVGVASSSATAPIVEAVLDRPAAPGDPAVGGLAWSGPDVTAVPGNPLQAEVARATAKKRTVTATLGASSASTTVWSVFAKISATAGPAPTFATNATSASPGAAVDFKADIFPTSIVSGDRPKLDGPNATAPPGGSSPATGNPLSGGADHMWDFSRKSRVKMINPNGISLAAMTPPGDADMARFFANSPWDYPATWEEGNDDSGTGDESNDPYGAGMTSSDSPTDNFAHAGGTDGDTFEDRTQFREFVRLELAGTWWVVSKMFPWRTHQRVRRVAGRWVDNGTSAAADNAGW